MENVLEMLSKANSIHVMMNMGISSCVMDIDVKEVDQYDDRISIEDYTGKSLVLDLHPESASYDEDENVYVLSYGDYEITLLFKV